MNSPHTAARGAAHTVQGLRELHERPVQLRGSRLARSVLRLGGWRLHFDGLPSRQGVLVIYPHTSNWDFVWGILCKWAMGIPVTFWGKDTLFTTPLLGRWMRWLGGVPVQRDSPQGMVGSMVHKMREATATGGFCWLAVAPEGTRSAAGGWRLGFYRVAVGADAPVACARLDYGRREVRVQTFLRMSGDMATDFAALAHAFAGAQGGLPHLAAPIQPVSREEWRR